MVREEEEADGEMAFSILSSHRSLFHPAAECRSVASRQRPRRVCVAKSNNFVLSSPIRIAAPPT